MSLSANTAALCGQHARSAMWCEGSALDHLRDRGLFVCNYQGEISLAVERALHARLEWLRALRTLLQWCAT